MNRNRHKIGWTITLITMGWMFFLLPSAEDLPDAEPATKTDWIVWAAINLLALYLIHRWVSEPSRIARREYRERNKQRWIEERRQRIQARHNHPTNQR